MFARILTARFALLVLVAAALAGCARPGPSVLLPSASVAPGAKLVTVYVATTRVRQSGAMNVYTNLRAPETNYTEFVIAIPPRHKSGEIEWSSGVPNTETDFVTVQQTLLSAREFEDKVSGRSHRKAGVFVHGYNTSFQEGVFRLAQLVADSDISGVPVLFAWPSDGAITGYAADRDSATYSRDALAQLLIMLTRDRGPSGVTVLGHSMGAWLTAESLRQLRLTGRSATLARLEVVLASPDIDVDVFRAQLRVIGRLNPPMTVLVSTKDRALGLSRFIAGDRTRLGALDVNDPRVTEAAQVSNVRIIDLSSVSSPDSFGHNRFVTFAQLYTRLNRAEGNANSPGQAGAFVFNSVGSVLSAPFTLVGSALAGQ